MTDSNVSLVTNILGTIVSKLEYPVNITYKGENTRISPRARISNIEKAQLGELPTGLSFIPNK